jgi:ABC-type dipeptide/oligopeptide/nickel transport system permease component
MLRYIGNRLLAAIPTVLLVTVLVFLMLHLIPGDPAEIFLGENFSSPELLAQVRADMGLDRPLHVQYLSYLGGALRGDFGRSLNNNRPVLDEIAARLPPTVELTVAALAIGVLIGVTLGIVSALGHNTWVDTLAMALALLGVSMPIFWMSLLLIFLFSVRLNWFPALSTEGLQGLVLPALALGLLSSSTLARMVRSSMLEVLGQDYVRTARAKGLRERAVVLRHALKNALIPTITVLGLQFGQLLGGAVITETIFARQGIGRLYVESILRKDFTMVQGLTLLIAVIYVLINLAVDVAYAAVDPRIQYE